MYYCSEAATYTHGKYNTSILQHVVCGVCARDAATYYDGKRAVELGVFTCHFDEIFYDGFTSALVLKAKS